MLLQFCKKIYTFFFKKDFDLAEPLSLDRLLEGFTHPSPFGWAYCGQP